MNSRYGLQIRSATGADAEGVAELMGSGGVPVAPTLLEARIEALRGERGMVLLAEEWGPPSGIAVGTWFRTLDSDSPTAQLSMLLVGPESRRRGIGRLLLKAFAQAARAAGCGSLVCVVAGEEEGLPAFLQASGFSTQGALHVRPLRKKPKVGR